MTVHVVNISSTIIQSPLTAIPESREGCTLECDTIRAIEIASEAHANDRWGTVPYVTHLALVAERVAMIDPTVPTALGWLHDVMEDHPEYEKTIHQEFYTLFDTLLAVTKHPREQYDQYIDRLLASQNTWAYAVKLADLRTNLSYHPRQSLYNRYVRAEQRITEHTGGE